LEFDPGLLQPVAAIGFASGGDGISF